MYLFLLIALSVLSANAHAQYLGENTLIRQKRVIGGKDANITDHPYLVKLELDLGHRIIHSCGGAVISKYYILTAGHCLQNVTEDKFIVRCGSSYTGRDGVVYNISKLITHPSYREDERHNTDFDVGLIKLKKPLEYSDSCKPIKLHEHVFPKHFQPNVTAVISGWGWAKYFDENNGYYKDVLQVLEMPLICKKTCHALYKKFGGIYKGQICAGYRNERDKDVCYGDSGSPLVWKGQVIGIAAYVESKCGKLDYPSVFTEVAYFLPWIKKNAEFDS